MSPKLAVALTDDPRRTATGDHSPDEGARRNLTPHGAIVEHAMKCARLEVKQLAAAMGLTESVLSRGFKDIDSISWQRVLRAAEVYPQFRRWLLIVLAAETKDVHVRTVIDVEGCGGL